MSRLRRIEESGRAFFATTHFAKSSLPVSEDERDTVLTSTAIARSHRKFLLAAYVVMPTHFHVFFVPAEGDTYRGIMREIKIRAAKQIQTDARRTGPFWQARSFDRIIRNRVEWVATVEYIHWNPVKDGLAASPGDWFWSSWGAYVPEGRAPIPVDRFELPMDERAPLRW